jgi:hypothetical protein
VSKAPNIRDDTPLSPLTLAPEKGFLDLIDHDKAGRHRIDDP